MNAARQIQPSDNTASLMPVDLDMAGIPGWACVIDGPDGTLWAKGYISSGDFLSLGKDLQSVDRESVAVLLDGLDGHFAFVWRDTEKVIAAVDPVATIPLLFRKDTFGRIKVSGSARRLSSGEDTLSDTAVLSMAMAGFTFGAETLFTEITPLLSGTALFVSADNVAQVVRYHGYLPHEGGEDDPALKSNLADLTLSILERMAKDLSGRTIVVPLSAGLDSRLIVSGLKELGYNDVVCISYGLQGNHEAVGAQKIARHLGYPWHFIPHTPQSQASTFSGNECQQFVEFADNFQAIPFQQDFMAVKTVKDMALAPPDAVFVNGQSGDFIAGNHIPTSLVHSKGGSLFDAFAAKHFGHWQCLLTSENLDRLRSLFDGQVKALRERTDSEIQDFGVFEALEYENRQSKYVVAGQRTYEWFGFEWRLPLWDRSFIDFWEKSSLSAKLGQKLYREMLVSENWGGVWGDDWWFPQIVVPAWMRPVRFAAKAAHVFHGKAAWHRFEKNKIAWLTDPVANYAIVDYGTVRRDKRGHRNAISWHVDRYLSDKGIGICQDGTVTVR